MPLRETLAKQGSWLFKYRSYLPLTILPFLLIALYHRAYGAEVFPAPLQAYWSPICILVSFFGLLVRSLTVGFVPEGTSGRNAACQRADFLNTTGIYSIVRNPLYLSNFLMFFGLLLYVRVYWFILFGILAFWIYYERIIFAEEEFLREKFGAPYLVWCNRTPAFFPRFKNWQPPDLTFSLKTVLKREYSGFFAIVAIFTALEILTGRISNHHWHLKSSWICFFAVGAVIYMTLRTLKKKTRWLDVEGR